MSNESVCGINKFVERDIDMLLAEELRVNPNFCEWIMGRFTVPLKLSFPAVSTNVSVVEDGSEADVVATFQAPGNSLHRLFIENKIDAMLMPEQLERYIRRGEGEVRRQIVSSYSILFCTPSSYRVAALPLPVQQVSFEDVAEMFLAQGDLRSHYRGSLFLKALPFSSTMVRDAHVSATEPFIKEWWDHVYGMLERHYPGFFVHGAHYPRSVYYAPSTPGQARYLRVDFKGHRGEVALAFKNIPADALRAKVAQLAGCPGIVVENGKSSAIQISGLDPFVISDGLDVVETRVRTAYQAAHDLLSFWKRHQAEFDQLAGPQTG